MSTITFNTPGNVTSITHVTATITTATITCPNTFSNGATVWIAGLTHTALNGVWTILAATSTQFTFHGTFTVIASISDSGYATTTNGWTVPAGITSVTISVAGAGGGGGGYYDYDDDCGCGDNGGATGGNSAIIDSVGNAIFAQANGGGGGTAGDNNSIGSTGSAGSGTGAGFTVTSGAGSPGGAGDPGGCGSDTGYGGDGAAGGLVAGVKSTTAGTAWVNIIGAGGFAGGCGSYGTAGVITLTWTAGGGATVVPNQIMMTGVGN